MHRPRPALHQPPQGEGKVLVLLAHPDLRRSRLNRPLAEALRGLPGVTVHDLYEAWPDLHIDVPTEQRLLVGHQALVWQHPFYWYSTPAILKQWQDLVLQPGWAYGPGGTALRGKPFLQGITTGGAQAAYQPEGFHGLSVEQLLAPIQRMARLCGMQPQPPFVVHGAHALRPDAIEQAAAAWRQRVLDLAASLPD